MMKARTASPGRACRNFSQGDLVPIRRPQMNKEIYMYATAKESKGSNHSRTVMAR